MRFPITLTESTSVDSMTVNPLTGTIRVLWFNSDTTYRYENVSRRSILAFLLAGDRSVGQWVNYVTTRRPAKQETGIRRLVTNYITGPSEATGWN